MSRLGPTTTMRSLLLISVATFLIAGWGSVLSAAAQVDRPRQDGPPKPPPLPPLPPEPPPDTALEAAKFGPPKMVLEGLQNEARSLAISPDGKLLAAGSHVGTLQEKNLHGDIRLWDLPSGKERATIRGHTDGVLALAFTPDSKHLVSATGTSEKGSRSGEIKIWDVQSRKEVRTLKGHRDLVYALAISNDGKQIASASTGGTVIVWDFATGQPLRTYQGMYDEHFLCVAFSPDGRRLAAGSLADKLRIWDVASNKDQPVLEILAPEGWNTSLAFSPDGKTLVSAGTDGRIKFWDAANGKKVGELYIGTKQNTFLAIARGGRKLVAGGGEFGRAGRVVIVDWASRKPEHIARWEEGIIWGIAVSPDGKILATIADKTIRLWEMPAGK